MNLIERVQKDSIINALQTRRIVLLSGPRQCGKTTLAKSLGNKQMIYRTLDDISLLQSAKSDPHGFIKRTDKTMIIDEIQRAPDLVLAIKKAVDEDTSPGQFLLTGSAHINSLPTISESLAGRVQYIRLRTISQSEIQGVLENDFLSTAFNQEFSQTKFSGDKEEILNYCFRGGYPETLNMTQKARMRWFEDYIQALLERDLKDFSNIYRTDSLKELIKILCSWSSKFLDLSKISTFLSINQKTLRSYINVIEILFLAEYLPSWIKTDYQRISRRAKFFISDTGIVCSLLRWKFDEVLLDSDRCGKIFETFVFKELSTLMDKHEGDFNLYHYRDREDREVDFVIERDDGAILGIEVKAGSNVGKNDFKHLLWFKNNIAKDKKFVGIILYTGEFVVPFGDSLWGVPIGHIWHN